MIEGQVLDMQDAPFAGATIDVIVPSAYVGPEVLFSVRSAGDGTFAVNCPTIGPFELRVSASGFPSKSIASTDLVDRTNLLVVILGIPCDGEDGPDLVLSEADRAAILSFLVETAFSDAEERILSDEHLDRHRLGVDLPDGIQLMAKRDIRRLSKRKQVYYVGVSELEVHGECVVAGYYRSCYSKGAPCLLCCESKSYTFRRIDGRWRGEFFMGAIH